MTPSIIDDYLEEPQRNVTFAVNYEVALVDQFLASARQVVGFVPGSTTDTENEEILFNAEVDGKRRSAREKKKDVSLSRNRVRYDMHLVPPARRHGAFLERFSLWWLPGHPPKETQLLRQSSRLSSTASSIRSDEHQLDGRLPPFAEDTSVLWIPTKRSEWEDSVSEMTAVCTTAALRRFKAVKQSTTKTFHAPLSRDYIRDRVDIDDPLNGWQIRHKTGGWMQGFLLWTNFTTWTHNFHWDSLHAQSGVLTNGSAASDSDGSLSSELEAQVRSGEPMEGGIVFPTIAEIGLVGGLGCGEYLMRMALDDIRSKETYKYVVLQATDQSKTFYERFGFVRVGAICRYFSTEKDASATNPIVGYRHWTHANESETSLQMHGGPSYMMCLKLPTNTPEIHHDGRSFLDEMLKLAVDHKPIIEQLGSSFTPGPKQPSRGPNTSSSNAFVSSYASSSKKKPPSRKNSGVDDPTTAPKRLREGEGKTTAKRRKPVSAFLPPDNEPATTYQEKAEAPIVPPSRQMALCVPTFKSGKKKSSGAIKNTPSKNSNPKCSPDVTNRLFYSVRGPDGRFTTIAAGATIIAAGAMPSSTSPRPPPVPRAPRPSSDAKVPTPSLREESNENSPPSEMVLGRPDGQPVPIIKSQLLKQKVRSYPRSRVHFFNRVVKRKELVDGTAPYYFVLFYNESTGMLRIAPLVARGRLTGKREGRPRYQVALGETDSNFVTVNFNDFVVVRASMVMKTPVIANEAWDIEDD